MNITRLSWDCTNRMVFTRDAFKLVIVPCFDLAPSLSENFNCSLGLRRAVETIGLITAQK